MNKKQCKYRSIIICLYFSTLIVFFFCFFTVLTLLFVLNRRKNYYFTSYIHTEWWNERREETHTPHAKRYEKTHQIFNAQTNPNRNVLYTSKSELVNSIQHKYTSTHFWTLSNECYAVCCCRLLFFSVSFFFPP